MTEQQLPEAVRDEFLTHLGLAVDAPPTLATLTELYAQWCAKVPYDNCRIRHSVTHRPGEPVVGVDARELLLDNISGGNASQCTETAHALFALLGSMGFSVELGLAYYGSAAVPALMVNHISVVVAFDDDRYLADTVLLSGVPIPLREHEATYPPLTYRVSQDDVGSWAIETVTPVARVPVLARIFYTTADPEVCAEVYSNVQDSGFADFNATFYARRNAFGEMITFSTSDADRGLSSLHRTTVGGTVSVDCVTDAERDEALRDGLGFSDSFVKQIPPNSKVPVQ